jgi:hypothetical protein
MAIFRMLSKKREQTLNICNQGRQHDQGNSKQKGVMMSFPETGTTFCNDDLLRFYAHNRAQQDPAFQTARTAHQLAGLSALQYDAVLRIPMLENIIE